MPWVILAELDVKSRIYDAEDEVFVDAAGESQNRLPPIITQIVAKIRGNIAANPQVTALGAVETIPDFIVADACVLCRAALLGLPPVEIGVTDPRREEYRNAVKAVEDLKTMNPKAFAITESIAEQNSEQSSAAAYGGAALLDF